MDDNLAESFFNCPLPNPEGLRKKTKMSFPNPEGFLNLRGIKKLKNCLRMKGY
jgi:hypothetical protein